MNVLQSVPILLVSLSVHLHWVIPTQWLFYVKAALTLIGTVWIFVRYKKPPLEVIMCYFRCRQLHFVLAQNCILLCVACLDDRRTPSLWGATTHLLSSAAVFAVCIVTGTAALTAFSWMTVNLNKSSFWLTPLCLCPYGRGRAQQLYVGSNLWPSDKLARLELRRSLAWDHMRVISKSVTLTTVFMTDSGQSASTRQNK